MFSGGVSSTANPTPRWFAAYTLARHEKRAAEHFRARQIEHFLPLYRSRRRWSVGGAVDLDLPLFPGYIFVRIARAQRVRVLEVPSIVYLVGRGSEPEPLPDFEIEHLRAGILKCRIEPHPYLVVGQRVRVKRGVLTGTEGILMRRKNESRVVLTLEVIKQSFAVEVDADDVEPVSIGMRTGS